MFRTRVNDENRGAELATGPLKDQLSTKKKIALGDVKNTFLNTPQLTGKAQLPMRSIPKPKIHFNDPLLLNKATPKNNGFKTKNSKKPKFILPEIDYSDSIAHDICQGLGGESKHYLCDFWAVNSHFTTSTASNCEKIKPIGESSILCEIPDFKFSSGDLTYSRDTQVLPPFPEVDFEDL